MDGKRRIESNNSSNKNNQLYKYFPMWNKEQYNTKEPSQTICFVVVIPRTMRCVSLFLAVCACCERFTMRFGYIHYTSACNITFIYLFYCVRIAVPSFFSQFSSFSLHLSLNYISISDFFVYLWIERAKILISKWNVNYFLFFNRKKCQSFY